MKNKHAVALGRLGGKAKRGKGSKGLNSEQARKAAQIRWDKDRQQKKKAESPAAGDLK
jgi:hypothetical protein